MTITIQYNSLANNKTIHRNIKEYTFAYNFLKMYDESNRLRFINLKEILEFIVMEEDETK